MYSPLICVLVIVCNLIKVICILITIRQRRTDLLFTVGDAIASFLKRPDPTTLCRSWMDQRTIRQSLSSPEPLPVTSGFLPPRRRWYHSVSRRRWAVCMIWYLILLLSAAALTATAYTGVEEYLPNSSISTIWKLGFDEVRTETMLRYLTTYDLIAMVLLSNTPQVFLSVLYYLTNSLLTSILVAAEYTSYSIRRKPLRVSWPEGLQRSTYFLSLPYTYSIPIMAVSSLLHWLLSLSIFYVRVIQYDRFGVVDESMTISTCNLSPMAMIFTLSLAGLALVIVLGLAFKQFPSQMPLAGNCSLAISAACHPPLSDGDAALKPVMWGESDVLPDNKGSTETVENNGETEGNDKAESETSLVVHQRSSIHHCSFTSFDVVEPVSLQRYV